MPIIHFTYIKNKNIHLISIVHCIEIYIRTWNNVHLYKNGVHKDGSPVSVQNIRTEINNARARKSWNGRLLVETNSVTMSNLKSLDLEWNLQGPQNLSSSFSVDSRKSPHLPLDWSLSSPPVVLLGTTTRDGELAAQLLERYRPVTSSSVRCCCCWVAWFSSSYSPSLVENLIVCEFAFGSSLGKNKNIESF